MSINPNLVIQLLLSVIGLVRAMQARGIDLEDKTEAQLKQMLRDLDTEMMAQPDLKERP